MKVGNNVAAIIHSYVNYWEGVLKYNWADDGYERIHIAVESWIKSNFPVKVSIIVTEKKEQSNVIFNDGYEWIHVASES